MILRLTGQDKNKMIGAPLSEPIRFFLRRLNVITCGIKRYKGSDEEICSQIIEACYNKEKKYFMVSNSHFCLFYARDFGWCTEALLELGHRRRVINTLDYALGIYRKHGEIKQAINPKGKPFTFPFNRYSPDALAFLIRSLKLAKANKLVKKYKAFLNKEIKRYYDLVIDKKTGLVRKDKYFSSMKDFSERKSSCYDNVMTAMLANDLKAFRQLKNPFAKYNYKKLILDNFWNKHYFYDDLSGHDIISGDANVLPFWSGLITDKRIMRKALDAIRKEGLDRPFPLKYNPRRFKEHKMIYPEFIAGNYERDTIWVHVGMIYIRVAAMVDKRLARKYLNQYKKQILKHKNFLEVYDRNGNPFSTLLYYTDDSMLWCANYLYLKKKLL